MSRVLMIQMALAALSTVIALVLLHPASPAVRHTCVVVIAGPSTVAGTGPPATVVYVPRATRTRAGDCVQR